MVGEGKPYLVAVIVLDATKWAELAQQRGFIANQPNAAPAGAEILRLARQQLAHRPRPLQVHFVHATLNPWTIEAGLLTPTPKVKRKPVEHLFGAEIADLHASHIVAG